MSNIPPVSDDELKAHLCLEKVDNVPSDEETTAFKKKARLHQSLWREARNLPIGHQPMRRPPDRKSRPLGSRVELEYARQHGCNFLTNSTLAAAHFRLANPEPHQTLEADRLWCDLLSSMPMCFNLFGELFNDLVLADRAVRAWWPDVPGRVNAVRFEWSPGRWLKGEYLENRSAFDVAFELVLDDGSHGILGVETKYHEDCKREKEPSDGRIQRYKHVSAASGILSTEAVEEIKGTDLQQVWLDHLLAASMPLHDSGKWAWAGFALVHSAHNPSYARATSRYRELLEPGASIRVSTLESLLAEDVFPRTAAEAFSERYLW